MEAARRFLILTLQNASFAIPITSLLEITVPRNIRKDPNLPVVFEGTHEYRGTMIPVVNMKKLLKLPGSAGGSLIVTRSARGIVGLLADGARELLETSERPVPLPRGVVSPGMKYYAGALRNGDELVLVINEDELLP